MDKHTLPKSVMFGDCECEIDSDFRNIIDITTILTDPDLLDHEKIYVALDYFYKTDEYMNDLEFAIKEMMDFISGCSEDSGKSTDKPLFNWEQDFTIIVNPINRILGYDVRGVEYLHWWTFLSAFMEIGECTFSTFVGIRDKLNRGVRLDKTEERIYKENRDRIILKRRYDSTTQALIDEIMGKEN